MNIFHQLDLKKSPQKNPSGDFYPLLLVVENESNRIELLSKIAGFFTIYSSELDRYVHCEKEVRDLFLKSLFRKDDLEYFNKEKLFPFFHMMNDEKEVLKKIIDLPRNKNLSENLKNEFEKYTFEITELLDDQVKHLYMEEVKNIFIKSIDNEDEKDVFNLTNFLLHYINWNNSFYNFYETTCDLIYTQLKSIENRFDNTFKIQLKAFLAYHSKVKVLKRFFEKRELGKISTISYLDWITEIKDFLMVEFEKIFGEQKAIEYILSIDQLLKEALEKKAQ